MATAARAMSKSPHQLLLLVIGNDLCMLLDVYTRKVMCLDHSM